MFIKRECESFLVGGFMKVNIFKEFLAGFFTTFFLSAVFILVISGGMFMCGFTCTSVNPEHISTYLIKALIVSSAVALLYVLWKEFDPEIVVFPILLFNEYFHGNLSFKGTVKALASLLIGSMVGVLVALYIFSVLFIGATYQSSYLDSFVSQQGMNGFDAVQSFLTNELRSAALIKVDMGHIGVAIPYLFLAIMFALFFDNTGKKISHNVIVIGIFTFMIYSLSGDLFLNAFSFVISVITRSAAYHSYIGDLFNPSTEVIAGQDMTISQSAWFNFGMALKDDISLLLSNGLMYMLVAVCGLFMGIFIKKEIFEIGQSFDEVSLGASKPKMVHNSKPKHKPRR